MDLSLSKIQHPTDKYFIQRCSLDNNQIFKRGTTIKEKNIYTKSNFFDYNVYLFIDKRFSTKIILPGNVIIFKKIIYVGKGIFNKLNLFDSRACKHHNDLLSKIILDEPNNYECLFFGDGMTYNEASCLEALWIKELVVTYNYSLSNNKQIGDLINKRREIKWENRINQLLNVY